MQTAEGNKQKHQWRAIKVTVRWPRMNITAGNGGKLSKADPLRTNTKIREGCNQKQKLAHNQNRQIVYLRIPVSFKQMYTQQQD
jgi:hypothetical protein